MFKIFIPLPALPFFFTSSDDVTERNVAKKKNPTSFDIFYLI